MTNTLNGNDLEKVRTIITTKNSGLIVYPTPLADSSSTATFDMIGTTKTIKVMGTFSGNSTTLANTRITFDALCNGLQTSAYLFVTNLGGSIRVKILDITWTEMEGYPNKQDYEMNLVESLNQ